MNKHSKLSGTNISLIISGVIIETLYILYMLIDTDPADTVLKYIIIGVLAFIPLFFIFLKTKKNILSKQFIYILILFSIIFQLTIVFSEPEMSDDIYRYIWDGKVQNYGISPYKYAPDDKNLIKLHSDRIPTLVNFPHIKTIYPPVSQFIFSISYFLFGESIWGMKLLFVLFNIGTSIVFFFILLHLKKHLSLLILFTWNPLILMETAINGHLDIVMVFFLLLAIYLYIKGNYLLSGVFFAFALHSKLIPIIFLPVIFVELIKRKDMRKELFAFFSSFIIMTGLLFLIYIDTISNMFLTALNYSSKWYFNNPVFYIIHWILKSNQLAHLVSFSILVLVFGFIYLGSYDIKKKIFYIAVFFILFNPTIHPWYLTLILGLMSIYYSSITFIWSLTIFSSYIVVYNFKISGEWKEVILQILIQYIPLVVLLLYSMKKKIFKAMNKS